MINSDSYVPGRMPQVIACKASYTFPWYITKQLLSPLSPTVQFEVARQRLSFLCGKIDYPPWRSDRR